MLIIIEPRISGSKVDNVIAKMGFDNSYRVEAKGFYGGIWLLWKENKVKLDIISTLSQLIHSSIDLQNGKGRFLLTCVYGSPIPFVRQGLWPQLEDIHKTARNSNWLCIGDFNAYKAAEDKQGVLVQILIIVVLISISWI